MTDFNNELYVKALEAKCARLEKALDKACDELDFLTEEDENGDKWDSFLWKEWCLSDKKDVEKM